MSPHWFISTAPAPRRRRPPESGKLIFHIFGPLAEFERDLIKERMQAGVHAARTRGRTDGPPKSPLSEEKKLRVARQMYENKTMPVGNILKGIGIPRSTFYKYVRKYADKPK